MNKTTLALTMAVSLLGCGSDDPEGRSAARLSELEKTHQSGSSTTVERFELKYDGANLREVNAFTNGTADGTARATYSNGELSRLDFADKEGDRAFQSYSWVDDLLMKDRYEVTGAYARDRSIVYDKSNGNVREESYVSTSPGSMPHSWLARYEYDTQNRIEKMMMIDGGETLTGELRYNVDGTIERASSFSGSSHNETWDFRYLPDGTLDEVTDTHNGRVSVSYGSNGLISDIRIISGSTTETYRYSYEDGSVRGLTFAPGVPMGELFDLRGKSYSNLSLLHVAPPIQSDIPHVADTGGGGGGSGSGSGSGGGGTNTCWAGDGTACDSCLQNNCCAEGTACNNGTPCYSFYTCASGCNGNSSCVSTCQSQYPQGATDYNAFYNCSQSYCASSCQ